MNNDNFTVLISGGSRPVSEHVYFVAIAFKMTEREEQKTYIKFCIKLKHSSMETIWMIQKSAGIGNW